jgi:hypothetical protein
MMAASQPYFPDIWGPEAGVGDDFDFEDALADIGATPAGWDVAGSGVSEARKERSDSLERTIFRLKQSTLFNSDTNKACCEVLNHRQLLTSSLGKFMYDSMQDAVSKLSPLSRGASILFMYRPNPNKVREPINRLHSTIQEESPVLVIMLLPKIKIGCDEKSAGASGIGGECSGCEPPGRLVLHFGGRKHQIKGTQVIMRTTDKGLHARSYQLLREGFLPSPPPILAADRAADVQFSTIAAAEATVVQPQQGYSTDEIERRKNDVESALKGMDRYHKKRILEELLAHWEADGHDAFGGAAKRELEPGGELQGVDSDELMDGALRLAAHMLEWGAIDSDRGRIARVVDEMRRRDDTEVNTEGLLFPVMEPEDEADEVKGNEGENKWEVFCSAGPRDSTRAAKDLALSTCSQGYGDTFSLADADEIRELDEWIDESEDLLRKRNFSEDCAEREAFELRWESRLEEMEMRLAALQFQLVEKGERAAEKQYESQPAKEGHAAMVAHEASLAAVQRRQERFNSIVGRFYIDEKVIAACRKFGDDCVQAIGGLDEELQKESEYQKGVIERGLGRLEKDMQKGFEHIAHAFR